MLYSEFVEGTGCKENEHNYKVYKDLEIMYMNSDMSKQEIYEYGKKLVDNSPSPEAVAFHNQILAEIEGLKEECGRYAEEEKRYNDYYKEDKFYGHENAKYWKEHAKIAKEQKRKARIRINELKWVLGI